VTKTIAVLGTMDTKGEEFAFLIAALKRLNITPLVINTGVLGEARTAVDIDAAALAEAAGSDLDSLRNANDRGAAMHTMAQGASIVVKKLYDEGRFAGIIGMGGSGGSSVISAAMRSLPIGVPKLLISTMAGGDVSAYVGSSDIIMMPSIVDVAGINRISRGVFSRAAGAIAGMVQVEAESDGQDKPLIAASMFGNTTEAVDIARGVLEAKGYEVLVFHATGAGGRSMEHLIESGFITGSLDITTTEWADELTGGILNAGPHRLEAAAKTGTPQIVVPGCIDMANFGGEETIPPHYKDRNLYVWNPAVTLMRTTAEENAQLGLIFAEKLNAATGPVRVLIPLRGFSILDSPGQRFWDPAADGAFIASLKANLRSDIPIEEHELNINDRAFAERCAHALLEMLEA
jgi:uncharacterized protein (UPF0261 family)